MDQIINWFILIIIFVFDPLAVALVIAFNNAMMVDRGIVKKEKVVRKRELYGEDDDTEKEELTELQKTLLMDVEDADDNSIDKEMAMAHLTNQMGDADTEFDKADLDKDGIVTEEEKREYYEQSGWKNSHNGNPYYTHPWFDWNKRQRWINDREAINYWLNVKGGNRTALSQYQKEYPTDFTKKTY
jgi:hypothetical protein